MFMRIIASIVVAVAVWLLCLLGGAVLSAVPPLAIVGAFLATWAWLIGLLAGLWYFASGSTWPYARRL